MPIGLFGINNDSINMIRKMQHKSINLNAAYEIGNEIALSGRIEYENSNWGKVMFNGEFGMFISKNGGGFIFDTGLGYGYPIIFSNNREISINGFISCMQLGGFELMYIGPTAMIETEYKKTYDKFSFCLAPYYRRLNLFDYNDLKNNNQDVGVFKANTFGLRIGIIYNISLKK